MYHDLSPGENQPLLGSDKGPDYSAEPRPLPGLVPHKHSIAVIAPPFEQLDPDPISTSGLFYDDSRYYMSDADVLKRRRRLEREQKAKILQEREKKYYSRAHNAWLYQQFPALYKWIWSMYILINQGSKRSVSNIFFYFLAQTVLPFISWGLTIFKTISSASGMRQATIGSWQLIFALFPAAIADSYAVTGLLAIYGLLTFWANAETCNATRTPAGWDLAKDISFRLDNWFLDPDTEEDYLVDAYTLYDRFATYCDSESWTKYGKSWVDSFLWALKNSSRVIFFWYYLGCYALDTMREGLETDKKIIAAKTNTEEFFAEDRYSLSYALCPSCLPANGESKRSAYLKEFAKGYLDPIIWLLNTFIGVPFKLLCLPFIAICDSKGLYNSFGTQIAKELKVLARKFWALEYLLSSNLFGSMLYLFSGLLGSVGAIDVEYSLSQLITKWEFTIEHPDLGSHKSLIMGLVNPPTITAAIFVFLAFTAKDSQKNALNKFKTGYAEELQITRDEAKTRTQNFAARWFGIDSNSWVRTFLVIYSLLGSAIFTLYRVTKSLATLGCPMPVSIACTVAAGLSVLDMWQTTAIPSTNEKLKKLLDMCCCCSTHRPEQEDGDTEVASCGCKSGALSGLVGFSLSKQGDDHKETYGEITKGYSWKAWVSQILAFLPIPSLAFMFMATPLYFLNIVPILSLLPYFGSFWGFGLDGFNSGFSALAGTAQLVELFSFGALSFSTLSLPALIGIIVAGIILAIPNIIVAVAFTDLKALKNRFLTILEKVDGLAKLFSCLCCCGKKPAEMIEAASSETHSSRPSSPEYSPPDSSDDESEQGSVHVLA